MRVGRIAVESVTVSPTHLVHDLLSLLEVPSTFTVEVMPHMPTLQAPRAPLEQVFQNLLGNAIKHHHRAEGHIRVSAQDRGDAVAFAVTDDGPGIPQDQLDRIFMPFYRIDASRNSNRGGVGLGLSIAQAIIHGHGGTIRPQNLPDGGLRVCVSLPR